MEEKAILIQGYWIEILKKIASLDTDVENREVYFKERLLECVELLNKIISLKGESE